MYMYVCMHVNYAHQTICMHVHVCTNVRMHVQVHTVYIHLYMYEFILYVCMNDKYVYMCT